MYVKSLQRREFRPGGFHLLHVDLPCGLQLPVPEIPDGGSPGRLDGHGTGLGFPGRGIFPPDAGRKMDGKEVYIRNVSAYKKVLAL